jgi:hypothetical protein
LAIGGRCPDHFADVQSLDVKQKALAWKSGHPDETAETGDMDIKLITF